MEQEISLLATCIHLKMKVNIKRLKQNAVIPVYGSDYAAGGDLYACLEQEITIKPGETAFVGTGLAVEIPEGYAGLVYARSGLASKKGLAPANKVGVIDADYRGEIIVALYNHSKEAVTVQTGERIAQMVVTPFLSVQYEEVEELSDTKRGTGGFGSTGTK